MIVLNQRKRESDWSGRSGKVLAVGDRPDRIHTLCFSPDGRQLVAACLEDAMRTWDLRLLREQLSTMGLDRETPRPADVVK